MGSANGKPASTDPSEDEALPLAVAARVPGRVLGIDPGLGTTGYAVMDRVTGSGASLGRLVEAGVLRPRAEKRDDDDLRLAELHRGILEIIDEYAPQYLAVERIHAHARHPRTAILMAHARGVILLAAQLRQVTVRGYAPTRIKKLLTGSGRAPKEQMQIAVRLQLGLEADPEPHDMADACAVALCHLASIRWEAVGVPSNRDSRN
ncbi:crossover junction endodeoxyribonuclease RuvC [bacterium]|nr:crossover junction endodeoxyribonuclease RuvC [bacterium]